MAAQSGSGPDNKVLLVAGIALATAALVHLRTQREVRAALAKKGAAGAATKPTASPPARPPLDPAKVKELLWPLQRAGQEDLPMAFTQTHTPSDISVEGLTVDVPLRVTRARLLRVENLMESKSARVDNVSTPTTPGSAPAMAYSNIIDDKHFVIGDLVRKLGGSEECFGYVRAGPRKEMFFKPETVRACIVASGGLCPGTNNVIRDIVRSLSSLYGVHEVLGIRNGFGGFSNANVMKLTPKSVANIHHYGGCILESTRAHFDGDAIVQFLSSRAINVVFVLGGDGGLAGALRVHELCRAAGLQVAIACVPKSVDNDINFIDRPFGFHTVVEEAQRSIQSAKVEAACAPNGIGIVKLMGRSTGFIAAHSVLGSGDVDLCLVPELPIQLTGEFGCMPHLERVIAKNGHAVIVVSEGAGKELLESLGEGVTHDDGTVAYPPIGEVLSKQISKHFAGKNIKVSVKYVDPSYMIRSVVANSADAMHCTLLAQNAVHGAMAGFTAFAVGLCNNRMVYLPLDAVVKNSPRCMNSDGRTMERIYSSTGQPNQPDTRTSH